MANKAASTAGKTGAGNVGPSLTDNADQNTAQNATVTTDLSSTDQALQNEQKAADLANSKKAVDPNVPQNSYGYLMSTDKAEEILKKYAGFTGTEVPTELEQARKILGK